MENEILKLGIIPWVCTIGVVVCGMALIIATTAQVIRAMTAQKAQAQAPVVQEDLGEPPKRRRRRNRSSKSFECPHCGADLESAQTTLAETVDGKTYLTKRCECGEESRFEDTTTNVA